jgi:hypothetical protein
MNKIHRQQAQNEIVARKFDTSFKLKNMNMVQKHVPNAQHPAQINQPVRVSRKC